MTYKSIKDVKDALLNLKEVKIGKWSAKLNKADELEMWAPNGEGRAASFYYFDKAVEDFCKWAGIPEKTPKPVTYDKTPSGSGPLGEDTSGDEPWNKPKTNQQAPMQGQSSDEGLGADTSGDKPWTDPAVDKRPDEKAKENGGSDPELGSDTTRNDPKWASEYKIDFKGDTGTYKSWDEAYGAFKKLYMEAAADKAQATGEESTFKTLNRLAEEHIKPLDDSDKTAQSDSADSQRNKDFYIPTEDNAGEGKYSPKVNTDPHQIQNVGENPPSLGEFHASRIVDTFAEPKRQASYQELVEASPSENLLRDIADPQKWAANRMLAEVNGDTDKSMFLVNYEEDDAKSAGCGDKEAEGGIGMGEGVALPAGGSVTHPKKNELPSKKKFKEASPQTKKSTIVSLGYALALANTEMKLACAIMADPNSVAKFDKMDKSAQLDPFALFEGEELPSGGGEDPLKSEEFDMRFQDLSARYEKLFNDFYEVMPFLSREDKDGLESVLEGVSFSIKGGDLDSAESMIDQLEQHFASMPQPGMASVGTKIRENWGENGAYQRDIEAETAEEMYHLVRSLGTEDSYDWSSYGKPLDPNESMQEVEAQEMAPAPDMGMGVQAADEAAKTYWSDYFKDYGEKMTKDDVSKKDRKDSWTPKVDETPKPENKGPDVKKAQMESAPSPQVAPADSAPMPEAAPSEPTAPVAPPTGPPSAGPKPTPTAGPDQELKGLGWTDEDLASMSDEDKQKIVQIKLKKPGSGVKETGPAPVDKTPKPAPPAGPPTEDGAMAPGTPQPGPAPVPADPKAPVAASKEAQMEQAQPAPAPAPAPQAAPAQDPAAQQDPQFAQSGEQVEFSPESEALKVYNQIMEQEVKATTAEQVPAIKAQILVQRLLTEVGMPINEARQLFGLTRDKGFNTLFK